MDLLIDGLACVILVLVVVEDLRSYRIRNSRVVALVALFAIACAVDGDCRSFVWHIGFAIAALGLMVGAFGLGLMGAGDAKLISAACLWIGPEGAADFAFVLLILTIVYGAGARFHAFPRRQSSGRLEIPFAPSIAGAWMIMIIHGYAQVLVL